MGHSNVQPIRRPAEHEQFAPDADRFAGSSISADDFKAAFRRHAAGIAIITADAGDGPAGLTVSSVFSVSVDPPLLVFSMSGRSSTAPVINAAETVVVHLLNSGQLALAKTFATKDLDRFADRDSWSRLATGEPYLRAAPIWLRGRVVNRMDAGDSTVVAVQAIESHIDTRDIDETGPLVYYDRTYHKLSDDSLITE